jgi:hypothetical protein
MSAAAILGTVVRWPRSSARPPTIPPGSIAAAGRRALDRAGPNRALPRDRESWHPRPVILWLALRRLLPLLAVLSLALTPVAAPAAVAGMHAPMAQAAAPHGHDHAMAMAEDAMAAMPCCPPEAAPADQPADGAKGCLKGCPLMALCLGSLASLPPSGIGLPMPRAAGTAAFALSAEGFASVTGTPPPEPPRA